MKRPRVFRHDEAGSEQKGFVAMALFGICAWGPTRQAAWDSLCRAMQEAAK